MALLLDISGSYYDYFSKVTEKVNRFFMGRFPVQDAGVV